MSENVGLGEPGHRSRSSVHFSARFSINDRIDEVFPFDSPRQNQFPVRREPSVARAFRSHRTRNAPARFAELLHVKTSAFAGLVAIDEHALAVAEPLRSYVVLNLSTFELLRLARAGG